jgi:hypothetical protein
MKAEVINKKACCGIAQQANERINSTPSKNLGESCDTLYNTNLKISVKGNMKYIVTISKEIIYQREVEAENDDMAVERAENLFEGNEDLFEEVYSEFEATDIKEVQSE